MFPIFSERRALSLISCQHEERISKGLMNQDELEIEVPHEQQEKVLLFNEEIEYEDAEEDTNTNNLAECLGMRDDVSVSIASTFRKVET